MIAANDNRPAGIIMTLMVSKNGNHHIDMAKDNLTQMDISRMYRCLSQAINKLRDLETMIHSRQ